MNLSLNTATVRIQRCLYLGFAGSILLILVVVVANI